MSDQSSESSCEWVVLNENDEDLLGESNEGLFTENFDSSLVENAEQSLNAELGYDAISDAVSVSIRSSLTSEELEWQYEQFPFQAHDNIVPPSHEAISHIEEISRDFDVGKCEDDSVANEMRDDDDNLYDFIGEYQEEGATVSKLHSYEHKRNDHINFILNVALAIVVSLAIGLGTGNFLGWSHKCYKGAVESIQPIKPIPEASLNYMHDLDSIKQNLEDVDEEPKKQLIVTELPSDNVSGSTSCLSLKGESSSTHQEISSKLQNNDIITDVVLSESSFSLSSSVLELKDEVNNQNFSDPGFNHVSNFIAQFDWNKISNEIPVKNDLSISNEMLSSKVNDNVFDKDEISNVQIELPKELLIENKDYFKEMRDSFVHEEKSSIGGYNLPYEEEISNSERALLKQFYVKDWDASRESNLTNQLRKDLNQIIQSLNALAIAHLTNFNEKSTTPIEDAGAVIKLYNDFQNLINSKIAFIDNFVLSTEYKTHQKLSFKYLQKMVYCVVDSVDYLMKMSFKTLNKNNKKITAYKFSRNISKVIFNFNRKWDKEHRFWVGIVEKSKFREFKKENKQWKKNDPFKHNYKKNNYKRYSMKS